MTPEERFEKNLDRLAKEDAKLALQLEYYTPSDRYSLCQTAKNEPNLKSVVEGEMVFVHDQEGALDAAQAWLEKCDLKDQETVYICGVGLGYFYEAMKPWLEEHPKAHVLFIEDDRDILHSLLHTPLGTEIVDNPRVHIVVFDSIKHLQESLDHYFWSYFAEKNRVLISPFYKQVRFLWAFAASYIIYYYHSRQLGLAQELLSLSPSVFENYFENLLDMPKMYCSWGLFQQFQNVPAIVCGAGPSMEKQLPLLQSLQDKALIFGGGSSLNVLNGAGIMPHFGGGVDPNPEQYHRLLMNDAFMLPFFFSTRMQQNAAQCIGGPKLYLFDTSPYRVPQWIEQQLGLEGEKILGGYNIVNLCMEMALHMGCNPIILVGLDLAYSQEKTYSKGVGTHPLWVDKSKPYVIPSSDEITMRRDIHGKHVMTSWQWVAESEYINYLADSYPHAKWINATEGGIGFDAIPNQTLQQAADKLLLRNYDLEGWVHATIQQNAMPAQVTQPAILHLLGKLHSSLEHSQQICQEMIQHLDLSIQALYQATKPPSSLLPAKVVMAETNLEEELAYQELLVIYDRAFRRFQGKKREQYRVEHEKQDSVERVRKEREWLLEKTLFLFQLISCYRISIKQAAEKRVRFPEEKWEQKESQKEKLSFTPSDPYENPEDVVLFADPQGRPLSETEWERGVRHGVCRYFYASGDLYCRKEYQQGVPSGIHEYLYPGGQKKASIPFVKGKIDGVVCLYTSKGIALREIEYMHGKRHGQERVWDEEGRLLSSVEWDHGKPSGTAREWYPTGQLAKENHFSPEGEYYTSQMFDENGRMIREATEKGEDYSPLVHEVEKRVEHVTHSLDLVLQTLSDKLSHPEVRIDVEQRTGWLKELHSLEQQAKHLQKIRKDLEQQKKKIEDGG